MNSVFISLRMSAVLFLGFAVMHQHIQSMDAPPRTVKRARDNNNFWFDAAREGRVDDMRRVLGASQDINAVNKDNKTALHVAVRHDQKAVVAFLLGHGANPIFKTIEDETPLQLAVQGGNIEIIRLIVEDNRVDINTDDLVSEALANNHETTAKFLIRHGAYANQAVIRKLLGNTPLFCHAALGDDGEVARLLAEQKFEQSQLQGALAYAVAQGHEKVIQLLLNGGAEGYRLLPIAQILREQSVLKLRGHEFTRDNYERAELYYRIRMMLFSHFPYAS